MVIPSGVAFFIKTGTIFTSKKWGKTPLYNEETSKETTMIYVGFGFIAVLLVAVYDAHNN
jgi:hypothetical protein